MTSLDLPEPTRSRVVGEMGSDLEDLYAVYRQRGLGEEEAARRALALLGASSSAMEELRSVHESAALRLLRNFARPAEGRTGARLAMVLGLAVAAAGGAILLTADVLRSVNSWTWLVAAMGGLGSATAAWKAVALHLHPGALHRPVEREGRPVFFLAATCALVGLGAGLVILQGAPEPVGPTAATFWGAVREAAGIAAVVQTSRAWRARLADGQPEVPSTTTDSILFWGAFATVVGLIGSVVGVAVMARHFESASEVQAGLVWGGLKVALVPTVFALAVLTVALCGWASLRFTGNRRERMPEPAA